MAGKPVMEGKGVLFKTFADIDVFDLEINAPTPDEIVRFCQMLEPTVGGINLEDIRSPDCFVVEERLRETLSIPVFHDDQHGTAIISGAALLNGLEVTGRDPATTRVVFVGAGAAAIATAEHYVRLGIQRKHILMCDQHGVIRPGREKVDGYKTRFANPDAPATIEEAFTGADVFVGLSAAGAVTPDLIRRMAPDPLVFALANPTPEIMPDVVHDVRPDAVIATGRTDYPNQVNNVLGFPFIFRGALDVRARAINEEMKMAATRALASLAREDVPEVVLRAYNLPSLKFGREYLIPKPFDPRVLLWVAPAVAWAAIHSGVASELLDVDEYRARLESRQSPGRAVMRGLMNRAMAQPQRVALTDADDTRVIRAARILADDGIASPILIGNRAAIERAAVEADVALNGMPIVDPDTAERLEDYAEQLWLRRRRRGVTRQEASRRLLQPEYFGALMVAAGDADAVVLGENQHYPRAIRPAIEAVGSSPDAALAGIYMMVTPSDLYFFADCTVNIDPDAERLTQIAVAAADYVASLGIEPRVAMLSFSNFGSVRHPSQQKVADAVQRLHAVRPNLKVDGEMQADTAVLEPLLERRYPFNRLQGPANVLIFPDLDAANICYKLLGRLGGAHAIGPILVGLAAPIHVLERDSGVDDIVNMGVIAAVDALERGRPRGHAPVRP
jgi:malate dehydrogenase (oxaloacetate-decarboxylating)(NADP+)